MLRVIEYFTKSLNIIQGHCIWYYSKACGTVSYSPFIAMDISCFRDKARYWSKIVMFFIAPAFDVPVRVLPVAMTFNTQKLWYAYSMVKKVCSAVSTKYRRVTEDGQRDVLPQLVRAICNMHTIAR